MKEKLKDILSKYFNVGNSDYYILTRVKEAFQLGTMTFDDFKEFDEEIIDDLVDYIVENLETNKTDKGTRAREMFQDENYNLVYSDCFYIDYSLATDPIESYGVIIQFRIEEKDYRICSYGEIRDEIIVINSKLQRAIQKQIEELGWNNE